VQSNQQKGFVAIMLPTGTSLRYWSVGSYEVKSTKAPPIVGRGSRCKIAGDYCEPLTDLHDKVVEEP